MTRLALLFAFWLILMVQPLAAQESQWTTAIKPEKVKVYAQQFGTKANEHLEFAAFMSNVKGEPHLNVYLRNGKNKKGPNSIGLKVKDALTPIMVGRVQIAKPMSLISKKDDGTHLFETFTDSGTECQIFYTIKGGKLAPEITIKKAEVKQ